MGDLTAATITLSGPAAVVAVLAICVLVCIPVWVATAAFRDWMLNRIEQAFRRRLALQGCTPEEIDQAWSDITVDPSSAAVGEQTPSPGATT